MSSRQSVPSWHTWGPERTPHRVATNKPPTSHQQASSMGTQGSVPKWHTLRSVAGGRCAGLRPLDQGPSDVGPIDQAFARQVKAPRVAFPQPARNHCLASGARAENTSSPPIVGLALHPCQRDGLRKLPPGRSLRCCGWASPPDSTGQESRNAAGLWRKRRSCRWPRRATACETGERDKLMRIQQISNNNPAGARAFAPANNWESCR